MYMKLNIGMTSQHEQQMVERLHKLLADEYVLYQKTWGFHWNLFGPRFNDLHLFFEKQFLSLADVVDEVAERILQLGGVADMSLGAMLRKTRLKEAGEIVPNPDEMITQLLHDHESIIRAIRVDAREAAEHFDDAGTNNFLCDLIEKHEKMAWMLRAFLTTGR